MLCEKPYSALSQKTRRPIVYKLSTVLIAIDTASKTTQKATEKALRFFRLFDGFWRSSMYLLLTGSLLFRALRYFCFCAPCRYVLKLIEAFSGLVEASRSRSRASDLHTTDSQLTHQ